jgi:hypothetical protein
MSSSTSVMMHLRPLCARSEWIPDSQRPECVGCNRHFSLGSRRSHCRCCGEVFCKHCCENVRIPVTHGSSPQPQSNCNFSTFETPSDEHSQASVDPSLKWQKTKICKACRVVDQTSDSEGCSRRDTPMPWVLEQARRRSSSSDESGAATSSASGVGTGNGHGQYVTVYPDGRRKQCVRYPEQRIVYVERHRHCRGRGYDDDGCGCLGFIAGLLCCCFLCGPGPGGGC